MPLLCPANTFASLKPQVSSDSAWSPQHSGLCHLQLVFYSKSEKGSSVINIQAYLCSHACLHYSVSNRCNVMCGYCGERKRMRSPLLTFISVAVIQWAAVQWCKLWALDDVRRHTSFSKRGRCELFSSARCRLFFHFAFFSSSSAVHSFLFFLLIFFLSCLRSLKTSNKLINLI